MTPPKLSVGEWAQLKQLWFALADAPADARASMLATAEVADVVRYELRRMLEVDEHDSARLDRSAPVTLGLRSPTDTHVDNREAEPPSLIGRCVGPFVVRRLIARGGMGAVYEADRADEAYVQRVAVKTLWRGADSALLLQRFRSERQILAGLQHPNISQLVDGGSTVEGTPWLAMEYVDGLPIDAWCDARQLGIPARLDLFRQVCAAVHHAHQRLVVHRDLKPGNVFVNEEGTVKLLDFGVAKLVDTGSGESTLTEAGLSPLTAAYAAPEQVGGGVVSTATDVYALGALLCALLAGAPPHDLRGVEGLDRLLTVRDGLPRVPSEIAAGQPESVARARGYTSQARLAQALRGELDAIAQMALHRDPARRYASAEALADDVRRYLRRDRVIARPDTAAYRLWSFVRRHRALSISVLTVLLVVLSSATITLIQASRIRAEARRTERAASFLAGIVSGANATSADPIIRLSPQGTLAQLLDSALLRVPRAFGDDAAMRARLYTAIGANIVAQGRLSTARSVLDSARMLAAQSDGPGSLTYARASLEYAALVLELDGPWAADEPLAAVDAIARRVRGDPDLATRLLLVRAAQALPLGAMRRADSLAALVTALEVARETRTQLSVRAESIRMAASSWLRRDPRDYLRRARGVLALADSLGLVYTTDQVRAQAAEIEALLVLGRVAPAADAAARWQAHLRQATSLSEGIEAQIAQMQSFVAAVQGDTVARRLYVTDAWERAQRSREISLNGRLLIGNSAVDDALARGDVALARAMAERSADALRASRSPLILSFAELYVGIARLADGNARGAEEALQRGLAVIGDAPDLASMGPRLRRPLAQALRQQGRRADADRVARLDPPRADVPACTPGGDWRGCPDR